MTQTQAPNLQKTQDKISPSSQNWDNIISQLPNGERYLYQLFSSIKEGNLTVINPVGTVFHFGREDLSPALRLRIYNPDTYDRILTFAALGFCEAYMEGWWDEENDNIVELIGLFYRDNVYSKANQRVTIPLLFKVITQRLRTVPTNIQNSRKNVQHHYDLGNDFYQHFLDPTMTYSCGYQIKETDSLEQMQRQKYELICKKLALQPGESLIEIGCGWGGMLIYAAENYGITGTGITLSVETSRIS